MKVEALTKKLKEALLKNNDHELAPIAGSFGKLILKNDSQSITSFLKSLDKLDETLSNLSSEQKIFLRTIRAIANSASDVLVTKEVEILSVARRNQSILQILVDPLTNEQISSLLNLESSIVSISVFELTEWKLVETFGIKKKNEITSFGRSMLQKLS